MEALERELAETTEQLQKVTADYTAMHAEYDRMMDTVTNHNTIVQDLKVSAVGARLKSGARGGMVG